MEVLLVIDMQEAILRGDAKLDLASVIERVNRLADRVRRRGGCVVFIQYDGGAGEDVALHTPGWQILSSIRRETGDRTVHKTLNDASFGTSLHLDLTRLGAKRVLVAGWATDLCVDATVRSAAALGFEVVVIEDCHTVSDRPHMSAECVIEHHHWVWANLISPHPVGFSCEADV